MVQSVQNVSNYDGNRYVRQTKVSPEVVFLLASAASGAIMSVLPSFSNPFMNQMAKEHANNHLYQDIFTKAVKDSGLTQKGLRIVDVRPSLFNVSESLVDVQKGFNAFYSPGSKEIFLNTSKASISGFHELGHAMNHLSSRFGKILQKCRQPGYFIAGLMGTVALFSRSKPKGEPRNAMDWVQDNCATIAFASMLPTVAEEALASYKGVKMAKAAGLSDKLVKNLKKFYGKALLSYAGYAFVTGLSVFAASKITDMFTRPKKVD